MSNYYDVLNQPPLYTQGLRALGSYKPQQALEDETNGIMGDIADAGLGMIGALGTVLDTPASVLRGLANFTPGRALGGIFDPSQRVSGKELFKIEDNPDSWMDDIGGIGAEIVTDPLFWINPLTKAGSVMKAAGQAPKARRAAGVLEKGAREMGLETTIRSLDDAGREAVRTSAKGSKPGWIASVPHKLFGVGSYGDDLLKKIDDGLNAVPGAGNIVDEPFSHTFGVANAWGDASHPIIDNVVSKLSGKSPVDIAKALDAAYEKFRYADWIPGKKIVQAGSQAAEAAPSGTDDVVSDAAESAARAIPADAPLEPESQSVMDKIRSYWSRPTGTGNAIPPVKQFNPNDPLSHLVVDPNQPEFLRNELPRTANEVWPQAAAPDFVPPPAVVDELPPPVAPAVVPEIPPPPPVPRQPTLLEQMRAEQERGLGQLAEGHVPKSPYPEVKAPKGPAVPDDAIPVLKDTPEYIAKQTEIAARISDLDKSSEAIRKELASPGVAPARIAELREALKVTDVEAAKLGRELDQVRPPLNPVAAVENAAEQAAAAEKYAPQAKPAKVGSMKSRVKDVLSGKSSMLGNTDPLPAGSEAYGPPLFQELIGPMPGGPDIPNPNRMMSQLTPGRLPDREPGFNPVRYMASLFQKSSRGGLSETGQHLGQAAHAAEKAGAQQARDAIKDVTMRIKKAVPIDVREGTELSDDIRHYIETGTVGAKLNDFPDIMPDVDRLKELLKENLDYMQSRGAPISELNDVIEYMPRNWLRIPGEDFGNALGSPRHVSPITENMEARDPKFKGMPTRWFNEFLSHDPRLARANPTNDDTIRQAALDALLTEQKYQGYDAVALNKAKQARAKKLDALENAKDVNAAKQLQKDVDALDATIKGYMDTRQNANDLVDLMHNTVQDKYAQYSTKIKKKVGMFSSDPLIDIQDYGIDARRSGAVAEKLVEFVAPHITDVAGPGSVPLTQALAQLGLGRGKTATEPALEAIRGALNWQPGQSMDRLYVPQSVVDDYSRVVGTFKGPPEVGPLMDTFDKGQSFFKNFALMRPGFHGRNKIGGTIQNVMTGLGHSVQGERDVRALRAGEAIEGASKFPRFAGQNLTDEQATDEIRKLFYVYNVVPNHPGMAGDVAAAWDNELSGAMPGLDPDPIKSPLAWGKDVLKTGKEKWKAGDGSYNPLNVRGVRGEETKFYPAQIHEGLGNTTEFQNRGVPFIEGLRRGEEPTALAQRIQDAHVDYSNLSTFERNVMRRAMPFYSFSKGALTHTSGELFNKPGGALAQTVRAMTAARGDEVLPEHLTDTLAIPLGQGEDGSPRYLTGLGLMPEDALSMLGGLASAAGGGRGVTAQLLGMASPLIKAPLEVATGRTVYQTGPSGGRELRDLDPVLGRIGANLFGGEPADTRAIDQLFMNTIPSQLSMIKTATDSRKGVGARALNLLTGAKVTDVPQKTQEALIRQQVQELMREMGGKGYERFYMPPEVMAKLTPEQQVRAKALNELLNELSNRAKTRAKEAKSSG